MKKAVVVALAVLGGVGSIAAGGVWVLLHRSYGHPSGSMYPTIMVGGRVEVNSFDRTPARGEVMVFHFPEHPAQLFTKRVIGLAGDRIEAKGERLTINGWEIPRCVVGEHAWTSEGPEGEETHRGTLAVEFLGHAAYLVFLERGALGAEAGSWQVKPGEYFVVGDNRMNSHDSRFWYGGAGGGVPVDKTVGRARALDRPRLPKEAEGLASALDACLAKRPPDANPPP